MFQDSPVTPQLWFLLSNSITGILTFTATVLGLRFKRRREAADVVKAQAEAHSLKVTAEVSQSSFQLEAFRELQAAIEKAEARREVWHQREDQMRTQIIFWRNKSEELDGQLADAQEQLWKLEPRSNLHTAQIKKLKSILDYHNISYAELDTPKQPPD